jgi:energy-coupling factor transporter ATP-binding protein EcfA2
MPSIDYITEIEYRPTFRTQKVAGMFDVPVEDKLSREWHIDLPIDDKPWGIGLIVGASGAGKTTIAKHAFGEKHYHTGNEWKENSLLDDFDSDLSIKEITDALSHVGFSSPPAWLLPFKALSNGQQFRAEISRTLLESNDLIVFDEFTSVVDRTVAKVGCHAIQKFIRKKNKKFVAVTCHYDVEEWLQPDWVYDVSSDEFKWGCLRRSAVCLEVHKVHHSAWQLFKGHHYLSADINKSAACFMGTIEGNPVGIVAVLPFPHPKVKRGRREHRTVVLPDYQGMGIGNRLSEHVAQHYVDNGYRYFSTTSHPAMIYYRANTNRWHMTRQPSRTAVPGKTSILSRRWASSKRMTASFEYIGN